ACGGGGGGDAPDADPSTRPPVSNGGDASGETGNPGSPTGVTETPETPAPAPSDSLPAAGSGGAWPVPAEAQAEAVAHPDTVVGTGTAASCTSAAFVAAVAKGGVITFNCGSDPVTIMLAETAKMVNNAASRIVIDGGGKVTLSGAGQHRILYMNTCDSAQT